MSSTNRVLITGATGFVGSWMTKTCPQGVEYIGLNREAYYSGIIEYVAGITHIVHLAPVIPYVVVEAAKKYNVRLLYCSSGIVYHPENNTEYRRLKMNGEQYCLDSLENVVIARLFTFFGKGLDDNKAITQFFKSARDGKPLQVWGDTVRSYMHGAELGRVMWEILFNGESGHAYDVGSTRPVTIKRLAERISAFTGAPIEYINRKVPVPVYLPNEENLWNRGPR
jgi:nucleoside-diphosphate-sugar epimerase